MKLRQASLLILSLLLTLSPLSVLAQQTPARSGGTASNALPDPDDDSDIPEFAKGRINKADYLQRRDEQIKRLRGIDDLIRLGRGNLRGVAVRQMQRQLRLSGGLPGAAEPEASELRLPAINVMAAGGSWTELGPAPIPNGQTTGTSTPVSGRTVSISIHPTNPDIAYVGTAQGGLYRTLNGGASWTQLMDNAQSLAVGAVAISPSNPSTVWVGTGESSFSCDSFFGVGVYRIENADGASPTLNGPFTQDGGGNNVLGNRSISKILVHPTDPNTIFVTTTSGIGGIGCDTAATLPTRGLYRSTNAGSAAPTFTRLAIGSSTANLNTSDAVFEPGNPNNLLVAVMGTTTESGGIYRTTNANDATPTFTRALALGTSSARYRVTFAITKIGSTVTAYAATSEPSKGGCGALGYGGQLRKSTNGGASWGAAISGAAGFGGQQGSYNLSVDVDPTNTNVVYVGGQVSGSCGAAALKKTTNGSSFAVSETGLHADTHFIAVAPSNSNVVYTGNDGGIYRSDNAGGSWTSLNKAGFNATQFQSIALHPTDRWFSIGGTQDNGTEWLRPDNTWTRADFGDGGFALIDQNATDTTNVTMYHTYYNVVGTSGLVGFARVTNTANAQDNGWTFFGCGGTANGINCNDSAVEFYAPMTLGPGNPNTFYFGTDRLYRSTNQGTNMTVVSQQFVSGVAVSAIGISRQNDNVRIVGLNNGKVFATSTGSTTMTDVTGPIPAKYVARAVIDPNNQNTAYVTLAGFGLAAGQHVWKTTNLNAASPTWTAAGNGIPDVPVNAFAVDPNDSSNVFAGTDIGVYNSTDGGANWAPYGSGLPVVAVFDLAIQNANRILRIATHGRGLWETSLSSTPPPAPAAPTALGATAVSSSQINLAWTDNANNEDSFRIERCQGAGCNNFAQVATVGANATTYNDTGLTASTSYSYRVRASNSGGDSGYSNTASATTQAAAQPPAAPTALSATAISASQINLAWTDNANNEDGFKIERCQGAGCNNFAQITTVSANVTSFGDTGLSASTSYSYRVRAFNASGGDSNYSNNASATTQSGVTPPAAPTALGATAVSASQINLAWTDNANNEDSFKIERCQGAGCNNFAQVATVGANATTYNDTGLTASTSYSYRVRASNTAGDSGYSNTASATTQAAGTTPAAPSNLAITSTGAGRLSLSWTDNSNNETNFVLQRCTGATCTNFATIAQPAANATSFTNTGLSRRTTYRYRIQACNGTDCSAFSNIVNGTTR